ncbi:alpha/beta hydrolase [Rhodococcus sp. G-MC3]|uniref:alpha/beta hydrolase n=1 Tax=Rhodococcus sp. G-MC3 TaxID=3046209 RepID=UPI0024B96DE5|nr:alpha/beta hydrolase [Rhodococcus sp. G-MC3]MDJ0394665.1 alpha/beta hydrolase [Rhodococcus sp. G-MC3]
MHFISDTSSAGVTEREFLLDGIPGVLWSPTADTDTAASPLILLGHSGGMHKKAPGLVASALHCVKNYGFTVAAIDAPGHGQRPPNQQDLAWREAIHTAKAVGETIAPIVSSYNAALAEQAVPEWRATLHALQVLGGINADAPVAFGGVNLGVVTGLMLSAVEPRIGALSLGEVFVDDTLLEVSGKVTVPLEFSMPWGGEHVDNAAGIALFDAFASAEKTLHFRSGARYPVPEYVHDSTARFFVHHLGLT